MSKKLLLPVIIAMICLAGCSSGKQYNDAPPLSESVSLVNNTARVERGNVESVEQHSGTVRLRSEELSFGLVSLRFGEYCVMSGDRVAKGQVLAKLDTELILQQIEAQDKNIERIIESFEYENKLAELDIAISRSDTARAELLLEQSRERQALTLQQERELLEDMKQQLEDAELCAPYDGIITWTAAKNHGDPVAPYDALIYISDEKEIFVELTEEKFMAETLPYDLILGKMGYVTYELEWIAPTSRESLYYAMNYILPPARFRIIGPAAALTPALGSGTPSGTPSGTSSGTPSQTQASPQTSQTPDIAPGTYAGVYLYSIFSHDVLRIPLDCVYTDPTTGTYVYLVEDGRKVMRPFEQGRRGDIYVEVISGLEEGDEVYVKS